MPVRDIRVQDRGSFFDDSFFKDSWDDFDTAMQKVLDRFDAHGLKVETKSRPECQDIYRKIRSNKINDDMYASQAIEVTEKEGKFQVVIDVRDFNPTELQVKVIDEKIVLEGRYDKVSEDGKSSSSKAFYREFMLPPEADIDLISTALSKDGILTIRAPRKDGAPPFSPINQNQKSTAAASQFLQNALNDHRYGNGTSSLKSNKTFLQNSSSYESSEGFDSLPRDVKERLNLSDRDSGQGSTAGSPTPSAFSTASSCASPAPSDAATDGSRVSSSMEYDTGRKNLGEKMTGPHPQGPQSQMNVSNVQTPRPLTAVGSGGTASISVKEEDGKRTFTSEKSSLVQQKDGFLESKELSAEVTEKDSQSARREAVTRMKKTEDDPEGKFQKSEAADASDVSESCVQTLPDGSVVTVKKSSTSTSNFKKSFSTSTGGPGQGMFDSDFNTGFGDMPNIMGRGPSLISQMSSDSLGSNMSNFSDMSSFSKVSDTSNMSSGFQNRTPLHDRFSNFPAFQNIQGMNQMPQMPSMGTKPMSSMGTQQMPPMGTQQMPSMNVSPQQMPQNKTFSKKSFSSSSQSFESQSSSSDNMKF